LRADCSEWHERHQKIEARWPRWEHLNRLLEQSSGLEIAHEIQEQVDAVRQNRSLINEPDPVKPIADALSQALRERLLQLHDDLEKERSARVGELVQMPEWQRISDDAKDDVLRQVELLPLTRPDVANDEKLLAALRLTPLTTLAATRDAIPERMIRARNQIIELLSPNAVVPVKLPSRTIKTAEDVEQYIQLIRQTLLARLGHDGKTTLIV
jgi:hypothetical protein